MPTSFQFLRLNLASAIFPFYTQAAGRTIIVPGNDENFDRYNAANTTPDKGVPQVFYMHNVMPIAGGFQSISYTAQLPGIAGHTDFDTCFPSIDTDLSTFLFCPAVGQNYIYDGNVGYWQSVSPLAAGSFPDNGLVTTAYVNGVQYIYYENIGCFYYNDATQQLVSVTLTGLTASSILGICEANGYMIAWSAGAVYWSSVSDPTNFIPSIQTGAGGGAVESAKGPINFCCSVSGGFIIYCEKNAVGASYTANTSFPYIIVEVTGSGGVNTIDNVAFQGNLPYHIAMTSAGIQQISLNSAQPTMPEVSDFLTAQLFEDFDEVALQFSQTFIGNQLDIKFACVGDRFIVISYGVNTANFTHAIIYDIALNRYGKLKLNHRSCFSFLNPTPHGYVTYAELLNTPISSLGNTTYGDFFTTTQYTIMPKQNLAFLQEDGTIQLVNFQLSEAGADGVFLIGKFQHGRQYMITHQWTDVETVQESSTFNMYLLPTFDGKDFGTAVATSANQTQQLMRTLAGRYTAKNLSLLFVGAFDLTSIIFNYTISGWR